MRPVRSVVDWIEGWGVDSTRAFILAVGVAVGILTLFAQDLLAHAFYTLFILMPIVGPPIAGASLLYLWHYAQQLDFLLKQEMVLLEIVMPRAVKRTPRAMELFFEALFNVAGEGTFIDRFFKGKMRPFWSVEIVSIEGRVRFFIYTRRALRAAIEARLYSYYPEVVVREAEDYTRRFPYQPDTEDLIGSNFKLALNQARPIRTYRDFRLDDPFLREGERYDPLASLVHLFAEIGEGEHAWLQIVFRSNKKEVDLDAEAKREIASILKEHKAYENEKSDKPDYGKLPPAALALVKAIERKVEQHHYQCGIRFIYKAKKDRFNGALLPSFFNMFQPFSSNLTNKLVPFGWLIEYNYPWQDLFGRKQARDKRRLFYLYQRRAWFTPYYWGPFFILCSEELATLFHPLSATETIVPHMEYAAARQVPPEGQLPVPSSLGEQGVLEELRERV